MIALHTALDTFQAPSPLLSDPPNKPGKGKGSHCYPYLTAGTTRTRRTVSGLSWQDQSSGLFAHPLSAVKGSRSGEPAWRAKPQVRREGWSSKGRGEQWGRGRGQMKRSGWRVKAEKGGGRAPCGLLEGDELGWRGESHWEGEMGPQEVSGRHNYRDVVTDGIWR